VAPSSLGYVTAAASEQDQVEISSARLWWNLHELRLLFERQQLGLSVWLQVAIAIMWDVVWTDPDRELVGEYKARKEKEETLKKDHKSQPRRRSASTASSRWSTDSPFAIFRARGLRKTNTSSSNAQIASSASSRVESPVMASIDRSPMSKTFDEGSRRSSNRMSTSFLERFANIESPLNTSPLISEKSGDVGGKLLCRLATDGEKRWLVWIKVFLFVAHELSS
jgi:hypothetical protein